MQIIPIRYIHESDKGSLPNNILDLAFIYRAGFPVASDFFVRPSETVFKNTFNKLGITDFRSLEASEEKLNFLLKEQLFKNQLSDSFSSSGIDPQFAWVRLIKQWIEEIKISRLLENEKYNLSILPVFPDSLVHAEGTIYFDKKRKEAVINVQNGSLNLETEAELVDLVSKIDKNMLPTRVFSWVLTDDFKITDCQILTGETNDFINSSNNKNKSSSTINRTKVASVNKIYGIKNNDSLIIPENIDGFVLPNITDSEKRLFEIGEYSASLHSKPLLYQIDGSHLTDTEIFDLLFLRTNKGLTNIEIVIANFNSQQNLVGLLDKFNQSNISSSKIWLEVQELENVINIESYIHLGIEKIVLNLDALSDHLMGDNNLDQKRAVETLIKFLESYKKILLSHKIKLLLIGKIALDEDIINFFVSERLIFFATTNSEIQNLRDYLIFLEKRLIRKKSIQRE